MQLRMQSFVRQESRERVYISSCRRVRLRNHLSFPDGTPLAGVAGAETSSRHERISNR